MGFPSTTVTMSSVHRAWLADLQRQLAKDRGYTKQQASVDEVMAWLEEMRADYIRIIKSEYASEE
jgi:hypothetical protein